MENFILVTFVVLILIFLGLVISIFINDIIKFSKGKDNRNKFNYKKLDNLYEEFILKNKKKYNEIQRQIYSCGSLIVFSILIVPIIFLIVSIFEIEALGALTLSIIVFLVLALFIYSYAIKLPSLREEKNKRFKDGLIDYIIDEWLSDFDYDINKGIDKEIYESSKFYEKNDVYETEDLMTGNLGTSKVSICEVKSSNIVEDDEMNTNFEGVFAYIELKNKVKNSIIITTKDEMLSNRNIVYTEDNEFNNVFNVYSDNQIDAYTYLNEKVRQDLLDLYKFSKMTMDIKISKNKVYLRFNSGPIFENLIFTLEEKSKVYKFCLMCDVIKDLNDCIINK